LYTILKELQSFFSAPPQPHEHPPFAELQVLLCGQPMHFCPLFFALIIYATAAPIISTIAIIAIISPGFICHLSNVYGLRRLNSVKSILSLELVVFLNYEICEQSRDSKNNNPAYDGHPSAAEVAGYKECAKEVYEE